MLRRTIILAALLACGCGDYLGDGRGNAVSLRVYERVLIGSVAPEGADSGEADRLRGHLAAAIRRERRWELCDERALRTVALQITLIRGGDAPVVKVRVVNSRSQKPLGVATVEAGPAPRGKTRRSPYPDLAKRIVRLLVDAGNMSPLWESGEMGCGC